jgi:D-alanyl-lipoteichoic acid acyltransferase DltB (MBOAT superfamily)
MISFALDMHWQYVNKKIEKPGRINESNKHTLRGRSDTFRLAEEYNFYNYMAYVNYFPLYIAGPVISFNAWIS